VPARPQQVVQLAAPDARSGVEVDEVAPAVPLERRADIAEDVVCGLNTKSAGLFASVGDTETG